MPDAVSVLHVGEDPNATDSVAERLTTVGDRIDPHPVRSGEEALNRLETADVDCVLSDSDVSDREGLELLREVRGAYPDLPYIFLADEDESAALAAGATDVIERGEELASPEVLANRIQNAVRLHRAERQLEDTERWHRRLAEASTDVVLVVDADGTIRNASPSAERILGYDPEAIVGDDAYELAHPADRDAVRRCHERGMEGDGCETVEYRCRHADGSWITAEARARDRLDDPTIGGIVVSIRDVTERKERERELERNARLVEAMGDGLYAMDAGGRYTLVNDHLLELNGYDREDVLGEDASLLHDDAEIERFESAIGELAADGGTDVKTVEAALERADGAEIPIEVNLTLMPREDGEFRGTVGVVRDISDRKERERELEQYETIVETVPDGLFVLDDEGAVVDANEGAGRLFGRDVDAMLGDPFVDVAEDGVIDEDLVEEYEDAVGRLLSSDTDTDLARLEFGVSGDDYRRHFEGRISLRPFEDDFRGTIGIVRDITTRREWEMALERYEQIVEASGDGVYALDGEGCYTFMNQANAEVLGYEVEELLGEHVSTIMDEEDIHRSEELIRELIENDRDNDTLEIDVITKDGERITAENHVALLTDEDGRVRGTTGTIRDISERKARERELEIYETAVESTTDGIAVVNEYSEFLLVNGVFADSFGHPKEDIVGQTFGDDLTEDEVNMASGEDFDQKWADAWEQVREEGHAEFRYETLDYDDDGTERIIDNRVTGMMRDDDTVIYTIVARDVTEQRERQKQIERLHESARELMAADSKDDVAREVVAAVENTLGFPANVVRMVDEDEEYLDPVAVADSASDLLGDRSPIAIEDTALGEAFRTGEPYLVDDVQERTDAYDDSEVHSVLSLPIGEYGLLSIVDDEVGAYGDEDVQLAEILTSNAEAAFDRVEKEQALRERERELSRQIDRLDQFANVVSHDLRNPLNVAKGHLSFVREHVDDPEHVDTVEGALDRMEAIIQDVLTLAREGDEATDLVPVDLAEIVEACWGNVDTREATLEIDGEATVMADESRLQQLLENLMRNGIDHVGDDVTLRVGDLGNGFYVEDDGPGIPEEDREQAFEAGFSTGDGGTGFGLNIVRTIAEAHDWDVAASEGSDGGARFEFAGVELVDG